MSRFAVCVPYEPGDPCRERLWDFARHRWREFGFEPYAGSPARPGGRNLAAEAAGDWEAAFFADADVFLGSSGQLFEALERALYGGYVCGYTTFHRLDAEQTDRVLKGAGYLRADMSQHGIWEGAFAISRELWESLGGFDERFGQNVGQETALIHAASTLARLERVDGDAYHLWHPDAPHTFDEELWPRYRAATDDPAAMRALLDEMWP